MKFSSLALFIGLSSLAVSCLAVTSSAALNLMMKKSAQSTVECASNQRRYAQNCPIGNTQYGCIYYQNGTTEYTTVNYCSCLDPNVIRYRAGSRCPVSDPSPSNYYIPQSCPVYNNPSTVRCSSGRTAGCVCYTNGTCLYKISGNQCRWCTRSNVVSFNAGQRCPSVGSNKYYVCDVNNRPDFCTQIYPPLGCLCYQNGTCTAQHVNQCQGCSKTNAIAVLENSNCSPLQNVGGGSNPGSGSGQCNYQDAFQCRSYNRGTTYCADYVSDYGCVCYQDGTCQSGGTNRCSACRDSNVVSVYEGKSCPTSC